MKENVKAKWMTLWRIIVAVGMVSVTFIAFFIGYIYYEEEIQDRNDSWIEESEYSDRYVYEHTNTTVRLKEIETDNYLTPELGRIFTDNLKDSITVFFLDDKRGFLNIYTGKIVVPAQFERAWVFSEGLGAVVVDDKVGFINTKGEFTIPCQFKYLRDHKNNVDFLFKDGYCTVMGENNKHGLIDKTGKWVIEPQYDYINKPVNKYRIVQKDDCYGLLDSTLTMVLPIEYRWITLNKDGILLTRDGVQNFIAYDYKTVLNSFVFDSSAELWFQTDQQNSEDEYISKLSTCRKYDIPDGCGLFDTQNSKVVTKGIYRNITAINNDLFECELQWPNEGVVFINSKGEVVK